MMKMTKAMMVAAVACGLMSQAVAFAEEDTPSFTLDPMVITASRMEQTKFAAQSNIDIITRDEIEKRHYNDLGEALKDVPGVNLQNYGVSGENYTSNRLYINGSQRIVVLIDGMRANVNGSSSGVLSPSEFANLDNIERIEVLKGSASTLYGADAVGGVINIITRQAAKNGVTTKLTAITGSYDKQMYRFNNRGREGNVYWNVGYQKHKQNDYKAGNGKEVVHKIDSDNYDFQVGANLKKTDLDLKYNRYKSEYTRPDNGSLTPKNKYYGKKDNSKLSLQWQQKFNDNVSNKLMLYRNTNELNDGINRPVYSGRWIMDLQTIGLSDQVTWNTKDNTMIAGFDFYQDKINRYVSYSNEWKDIKQTNRAVFLQDNYKLGKFNITPGIRYTKTSDYGSKTSKSISFGYNNDSTNVYAGYKEFFYAPIMNYRYYNAHKNGGNPYDLDPESGRMIELGINQKIGDNTLITAHIYRTKADNLVQYGKDHYINTGKTTTYGWSLGAKRQFSDKFSANVNYTHTRVPSTDSNKHSNYDGYIPSGQYTIGMDYSLSKFNANLSARGIIKRPGRLANEKTYGPLPNSQKTFWTADIALNYTPSKNWKVYGKVNNLFDKYYTDQMYNAVLDPKVNGTNWYPAPGRNFVVGVEYSF